MCLVEVDIKVAFDSSICWDEANSSSESVEVAKTTPLLYELEVALSLSRLDTIIEDNAQNVSKFSLFSFDNFSKSDMLLEDVRSSFPYFSYVFCLWIPKFCKQMTDILAKKALHVSNDFWLGGNSSFGSSFCRMVVHMLIVA